MVKTIGKIAIMSCMIANAAYGATANATLAVTATVAATCTISTTAVAFGSLTNFTVNNDNQGSISVTCTNTAPYTIALGVGGGTGATFASRKMTIQGGGTSTLNYTLYTTAARTTIWGDGTNSTSTVSGTGSGVGQDYIVYGRVPIQTQPPLGQYADTVNVTLSF